MRLVPKLAGLAALAVLAATAAYAQTPPAAPRTSLVLVPGVQQGDWSYMGGDRSTQSFLRRAPAAPGALPRVEIRREQMTPTAAVNGLSARGLIEVDCNRGRARDVTLDVYAGRNLSGPVTALEVTPGWYTLNTSPSGWMRMIMVCATDQVLKPPTAIRGVTQGDWTYIHQLDGNQMFARRIATVAGRNPQIEERMEYSNDDPQQPGRSISLVTEYDCVSGRSRILRSLIHVRHNMQGESMALPTDPEWAPERGGEDSPMFVFACFTLATPGAAQPAPPPLAVTPSIVAEKPLIAGVRLDGWTWLEEDSARQYFWRRETTSPGANFTLSLRGEYRVAQGEAGQPSFLSSMFSFDLRCRDRAMRLIQSGLWMERNMTGPGGLRPNEDKWEPVTPDTVKDSLMRIACGPGR